MTERSKVSEKKEWKKELKMPFQWIYRVVVRRKRTFVWEGESNSTE
jgi:hypothetical protein